MSWVTGNTHDKEIEIVISTNHLLSGLQVGERITVFPRFLPTLE